MTMPVEAMDGGLPEPIPSDGFAFPFVLYAVQHVNREIYLDQTIDVSDEARGFVVRAPGTARVVAVVEQTKGEGEATYLAQTFRIKKDDDATAYQKACRTMMEETVAYEADSQTIVTYLRQLYLGFGTAPGHISLLRQCNDPRGAQMTMNDMNGVISSESSPQNEDETEGPGLVDLVQDVEALLRDDDDVLAAQVYDAAIHMVSLPSALDFSIDDEMTVYRSRLNSYPFSVQEGRAVVTDLVLIKVNDGSNWFIGRIPLDKEVVTDNVGLFLDYDNMLVASQVAEAIVDELTRSVQKAHQISIGASGEVHTEEGVEIFTAVNPYELLENTD